MARERGRHEASHVAGIGSAEWKDRELKRVLLEPDWALVTPNSEDFRGPSHAPGTKGRDAHERISNPHQGNRRTHWQAIADTSKEMRAYIKDHQEFKEIGGSMLRQWEQGIATSLKAV